MNTQVSSWKYNPENGRYELDLGDKKTLRILDKPSYFCIDHNDLSSPTGLELGEFIIYYKENGESSSGVSIIIDGFSHGGGDDVPHLLEQKAKFFSPEIPEKEKGLIKKLFESFESKKLS